MQDTQEMQVWSLGWDNLLEKAMAVGSPEFLCGKFHGQRSLEGYNPWESQRVRHDWTLTSIWASPKLTAGWVYLFMYLSFIER